MPRKRKPENSNPINTPRGIADDSDQFDDPHGLESAYRRGFARGAHFAIEANRRGWTLDDLAGWVSRIYRWRRTVHKGRMEGPGFPTSSQANHTTNQPERLAGFHRATTHKDSKSMANTKYNFIQIPHTDDTPEKLRVKADALMARVNQLSAEVQATEDEIREQLGSVS